MAVNFRTNDVDSNTFARFPVNIRISNVEFTTSNWSTPIAIANSNADIGHTNASLGYRVENIFVSSNDTVNNNLQIYLQKENGAISAIPIAFCPVLNGAGTDFVEPTISLLQADTFSALTLIDNNGNPYIAMDAEWKILAKLQGAPSTNKTIQIVSICNDY